MNNKKLEFRLAVKELSEVTHVDDVVSWLNANMGLLSLINTRKDFGTDLFEIIKLSGYSWYNSEDVRFKYLDKSAQQSGIILSLKFSASEEHVFKLLKGTNIFPEKIQARAPYRYHCFLKDKDFPNLSIMMRLRGEL